MLLVLIYLNISFSLKQLYFMSFTSVFKYRFYIIEVSYTNTLDRYDY